MKSQSLDSVHFSLNLFISQHELNSEYYPSSKATILSIHTILSRSSAFEKTTHVESTFTITIPNVVPSTSPTILPTPQNIGTHRLPLQQFANQYISPISQKSTFVLSP